MALKIIWIVVMVVLMAGMIITTWLAILGVAVGVALFWYWPRFDIMWEYIYCDGQIDFDQILGGEKRKTILRIEIENADVIAPSDSERLGGYSQLPVKDYSSLEDDAKKYAVVTKLPNKDSKVMILFEPSEQMLDMMHAKCPNIVVIN